MKTLRSTIAHDIFHTVGGKLVMNATSGSLSKAKIIAVCIYVNENPGKAKKVVKAVKKRLLDNSNLMEVNLSLTLLESLVYNCQNELQRLVFSEEFCSGTLVELIGKFKLTQGRLVKRVLDMIKKWAEIYGGNSSFFGVVKVYEDLKIKSYYAADSMAFRIQQQQVISNVQMPTQAVVLTRHQVSKLLDDITVVKNNIMTFSAMLTHLNPLTCDLSDYNLLREINQTCLAMQQRIVILMKVLVNNVLFPTLCTVNDDLSNVLMRYNRFQKMRENENLRDITVKDVKPSRNIELHSTGTHISKKIFPSNLKNDDCRKMTLNNPVRAVENEYSICENVNAPSAETNSLMHGHLYPVLPKPEEMKTAKTHKTNNVYHYQSPGVENSFMSSNVSDQRPDNCENDVASCQQIQNSESSPPVTLVTSVQDLSLQYRDELLSMPSTSYAMSKDQFGFSSPSMEKEN